MNCNGKGAPVEGCRDAFCKLMRPPKVIPWDTLPPVHIGNTMYVDFAHAAAMNPDKLVRDEQGRVVGIQP